MNTSSIKSEAKSGSVLGGILLISGSCIGAGMLALPVITGVAGFVPSTLMFLLAWLFMTITSLLLLEANLVCGYNLSLTSIAERTLGKVGKFFAWVLFLFLFYSLSVAYISASGSILENIVDDIFGLTLPAWIGSTLFTVIFGAVIYIGTKPVDYLNRVLMVGLIAAYCVLVILGVRHIHLEYLGQKYWKYAISALPVLIISFGFHNMIPSLAMYLNGDAKRLRTTVLIGSLIPLFVYLIWEAVMLGIIPVQGREGLVQALDQGEAATSVLRKVVGRSWINVVAQSFALFAIVTSFLAQSLSLVDFLADGLKFPKVGFSRFTLVLLSLVPPFSLAFIYPGIFLKALNYAGGFSAVILFGVMPALMVWTLRYKKKEDKVMLVPFGKTLLVLVLIFGFGVFFLEAMQELGFSLTPPNVEAIP